MSTGNELSGNEMRDKTFSFLDYNSTKIKNRLKYDKKTTTKEIIWWIFSIEMIVKLLNKQAEIFQYICFDYNRIWFNRIFLFSLSFMTRLAREELNMHMKSILIQLTERFSSSPVPLVVVVVVEVFKARKASRQRPFIFFVVRFDVSCSLSGILLIDGRCDLSKSC